MRTRHMKSFQILEIRRANTLFYFQNLSYLSLDEVYFCICCAYPIKTCMNLNEKIYCLLHYSFTFRMTPKTYKYVDQEKQNNFSCKHEFTWKSMEFSEGGE